MLEQKDANALWKQLKRLLSLLLHARDPGADRPVRRARPTLGAESRAARSVVILVDASASMKALDEQPGGSDAGNAENAQNPSADGAAGAGDAPSADAAAGADDGPRVSRMQVAKEKARELLDAMGGGDPAMIVRIDGQTTPLSRFDDDMAMLKKIVAGIEPSDTPADLARALTAAADALRERQNPMIILIGDGAYASETRERVIWQPLPESAPVDARLDAIDLSGPEGLAAGSRSTSAIVPVGTTAARTSASSPSTCAATSPNKASYEVFVEVQNFGSEPARRKLVLYNGDTAVDVKTIDARARRAPARDLSRSCAAARTTSCARARCRHRCAGLARWPGRGSADSSRSTTTPTRSCLRARSRRCCWSPATTCILEGAMLVYDNIQVDKLTPAEYDAGDRSRKPARVHAVVFDEHTPAKLPPPPTHLLYFDPRGEHSPFVVRSTVPTPRITEVDESHPVMRWVPLTDVNFIDSSVFAIDPGRGDVVLASYVRDPIIAARARAAAQDRRFRLLAEQHATSPCASRFPLLLVNTLDWFAGDDADLITTYRTGQRLRVPLDGVFDVPEVEVELPNSRRTRAPVIEGLATFYGAHDRLPPPDRARGRPGGGAARARGQPGQSRRVPHRAASARSPSVARRSRLPKASRSLRGDPCGSTWRSRPSACSCIEWLTYHRRITV